MKDLSYYLGLAYTFELVREDESTWFARVRELPGCMTEGDSPEDALAMIQDALPGWLEAALESGYAIPEPRPAEEYSGKFNVRLTRSLHRDLVTAAEREGVSLNQYISTELARSVSVPIPVSSIHEAPMSAVVGQGNLQHRPSGGTRR